MINCIIIDDKQDAIDIIVSHIESKPELKLLNTFTNPVFGLDFILQNQIDLVFLDIDMPILSGLELIETLKAKNGITIPQFILATGHEEFALKSYEFGIVDYIIKPISFKRFNIAVDRVIEHKVISNPKKNHFYVESEGKKVKINFEDIAYIESTGNYIKIFKNEDRITIHKSLNEIEKILPNLQFIRIHKSFIISMDRIEAVNNNNIFIKHQSKNLTLPIGRTYKANLMKMLNLE